MKTVPQVVENLIKNKPFLEKSLFDGLINHSALAKQLLPEIEKELFKTVSLSSIVMALKRLKPTTNTSSKFDLSLYIEDIIARSNLIDYTYQNSPTLNAKHQQIFNQLSPHTFFAVSQGSYETTLLFSSSLKPLVASTYHSEMLLFKAENLSSISIKLTPEATAQPGVHYNILKILAWENINIAEIISTYTELNIFLKQDDINHALSVLKPYL